MAVSYLELAKEELTGDNNNNEPEAAEVIEPGEALVFNKIVSSAGSMIGYDDETGTIQFFETGYYYINWFVAPQFGLTTNGSNWAIQNSEDELSVIGSSHTRVSATTGFAMIHAQTQAKEAEMRDPPVIETARLVNVSDSALTLSQAVRGKAGLIVINVPDV